MPVQDYLSLAAPAGTIASGLGGILDSSQLKDLGLDFGGISGLYSLGTGIAGDDPKKAVSGLADIAKMLSQVPGIEGLASTVPYIGSLLSLFKLGQNVAGGNPATILASLPSIAGTAGSIAGTGALGSTLAAAAPALSTVGAFAIPAAAAAFLATNTMRKDAERQQSIIQEMQRGHANVQTGLNQLARGAGEFDPAYANEIYNSAMQGVGAIPAMSDPFNKSGLAKMGMKMPDYAKAISATQTLLPRNIANAIQASDALSQQGVNMGAPQLDVNGQFVQGTAPTAAAGYQTPEQWFRQMANYATPYGRSADNKYLLGANGQMAGTSAEANPWPTMFNFDQGSREFTIKPEVMQDINAVDPSNLASGLTSIFRKYNPGFDTSVMGGLMKDIPTVDVPSSPTPTWAPPKIEDPLWAGGVYRGPAPGDYNY